MDTLQTSVTQLMQGQVAGYDLRLLGGEALRWLITSVPQIILILVGVTIARKLSEGLLRRFMEARLVGRGSEGVKRADTLTSVIQYTISIVLWAVAAMMILNKLGIAIGPILTAAGVVGIAVGFGAQKLVEDIIGGFFILLEDMIRVGDVVQIADRAGLVEKVTLRMVILRGLDGNVHYVRNGEIGVVTNMTKGFSRYVFDIRVAYQEDVDRIIEIVREVDAGLREDPAFKDLILEPMEILGVDSFTDSALILRTRIMTQPIQQWSVGREFNRRLKQAFDRHGVRVPFPHQTVAFGQIREEDPPAPPFSPTPSHGGGQPV